MFWLTVPKRDRVHDGGGEGMVEGHEAGMVVRKQRDHTSSIHRKQEERGVEAESKKCGQVINPPSPPQ